jgi:hypothetical protein
MVMGMLRLQNKTEKLEIREGGLGGVLWGTRKREERLTRDLRKKQLV